MTKQACKNDICAGIVSKSRIVPEWCFINLIQNIKQIKAVSHSLIKINGLEMCLKLKYESYILITIM